MGRLDDLIDRHNYGGDSAISSECSEILDRHLRRRFTKHEEMRMLPLVQRVRTLVDPERAEPEPEVTPVLETRWRRGEHVRVLPTAAPAVLVAVGRRNAFVRIDGEHGLVRRVPLPLLIAAA